MRPSIGITKPERGDNLAFAAIAFAVWLAGGNPFRLTPGMNWKSAQADGLVLGGGSDVFPPFYNKKAIDGARYDKSRGEMEMYWAKKARDKDIPTLAICRGAQVMNVAGGGTLHQELTSVYENADYPSSFWGRIFYRKQIMVDEQSLLVKLLGQRLTRVNSIHSQAVATPGEYLEVTARETNGVVQAIEDRRRPFYLGVQFHPEFLIYRRDMRALFKGLVSAAKKA